MNKFFSIVSVVVFSLISFACGQAVQSAPKAPMVHGEPDISADVDSEAKSAPALAEEIRKLDEYSRAEIEARSADVYVVARTVKRPMQVVASRTDFGDVNKPCETRYQIIGFESKTPLFGSEDGAAEYALNHPNLFPPAGKDADGSPLVTIITRKVCLDKYTDAELAVR